jgi:hypothetical protein
MDVASIMKKILPLVVLLIVSVAVIFWNGYTQAREQQIAIEMCQARAAADVADAGAQGRLVGLAEAADIRRTTDMTRKALEEHDEPHCNPMQPPYQPCCGSDIDADGWASSEEFTKRSARDLLLSCARTAHQKPEQGAPWVCGRTMDKCLASKQRAGSCEACLVYMGHPGEDFVWTGHAIDEVDGPWTADGKRGVFP